VLLGAAALACACTGSSEQGPTQPVRVELAVDGGDDAAIGTAPVRAVVPAGATVALTNANTGASPTHVFTSLPPGQAPALFTRARGGALPNAAVWGLCLGGRATAATRSCPVPPIEGPTAWDGEDYASLGSVLPGEVRELRLSPALDDGRELRLWCSLHPDLQVTLEIGDEPSAAPTPAPVDPVTQTARRGEVLVAPQSEGTELLAYVPAATTVRAGGTVTWRVPGPAPHTVELLAEPELEDTTPAESVPDAPAGGWDGRSPIRSGFLSTDPGAPGGSAFSVRFLRPGRYAYACRFHPQMRGEIVVTA
jgi:plastocyanin